MSMGLPSSRKLQVHAGIDKLWIA